MLLSRVQKYTQLYGNRERHLLYTWHVIGWCSMAKACMHIYLYVKGFRLYTGGVVKVYVCMLNCRVVILCYKAKAS